MNNEFGNKTFPVWMISEIEFSFWEQKLNGPFDYRLPMRHVICTSVFNKIQETVFRLGKKRVQTENFYIRNILPQDLEKPNINDVMWDRKITSEMKKLQTDIENYKPAVILAFGAFTFESLRRIEEAHPERSYGSWTPADMGEAFRERIENFSIQKTNIFPMLDRSISGWKFLESHKDFVNHENGDYFSYTGQKLGEKFIEYQDQLKIWLE